MSKRNVGVVHVGPFSQQKPTVLAKETGEMQRWIYDLSGKVDSVPRFTMGVGSLSDSCKSTILGSNEERAREKSCIVVKGKLKVKWDGKEDILNRFDYLYVPPNISYEIEDVGHEELVYVWFVAPSLAADVTTFKSSKELRIFRTLQLKPDQSKVPGNEKTQYEIRYADNFNFGLVERPAGTFAPMHIHDPADSDEGFVVLEGRLQITDTEGKSRLLEPWDFAYVPPFGGNLNRNSGSSTTYYVYAEAPAVEIKMIPVAT